MKTAFLCFFLLTTALQVYTQVNLTKGLVAWYPFNGNAKDESGNGNNASVVNASFVTDRFGKTNAACSFNGKSNYIRIPDDASLHFKNGFSISAWVMVKGFYEGNCHGNRIIMKGYTDYLQGNYLLTFDDNHSSRGQNCNTIKPDTKRQSFYAAEATPVTDDYIVPGKWYQLTYTYDGYNTLLYVDCKIQARGVINNYNFSNNDDLIFGKMDNSRFPYWFNGLLDEVRLYNRPLNKNEILALCSNKPLEQATGTICNGGNTVAAKFDYTLSDCTVASFNLTSSKTKDIKSIKWFFGDGTTSAKLAPQHLYKKYGSYKVKAIVTSKAGCADTFSRVINIQELQADFVYAEQGEPGTIAFRAKNNKATYAWNFADGSSIENESVTTHRFSSSGEYDIRMMAKNNTGCTDTVLKKIAVLLPVSLMEEVILPDAVNTIAPLPAIAIEKRARDLVRTIPIENDSILISLYDNGIIDGDSITLIYNDKVILSHQLLSGKALHFSLKVEKNKAANNELTMYAENLGSIPPNTALMIINDGNNRHQVNISSSKSSNGVVSFTMKQ